MVAVLLTTFSVLALVSARADLRLSDKAVSSTQSYYAADSEAQRWLADVDVFVREGHADLEGELAAAGYQPLTTDDGLVGLAESFSIDDNRELAVEITLDRTGEIDILRWQTTLKQRGTE
jgi:hypothetical protein